ncbi:non-canonical purine NTP diphosphatase [Leptobacterium sp. I13]|uniref:non-canonical purine NTP diphosphatase n=1 Tax=Leptobacterium meishanense TaxID=3128904 RepID=UPI0030EC3A76
MQLVFATHNKNKFIEVKALLPSYINLLSLEDIHCTKDIPETGQTIEENAILKANFIQENYNLNCFADDTGLEVEALGGAPGVHSARYAGANKNSEANIQKLLQELKEDINRKARFKTVIALNLGNEKIMFQGIVNGQIAHEKKGNGGFGYDPVFIPEGHDQTFAELPLTAKNKISHRAQAMHQLIDYLK